jgi:hypothetical protein
MNISIQCLPFGPGALTALTTPGFKHTQKQLFSQNTGLKNTQKNVCQHKAISVALSLQNRKTRNNACFVWKRIPAAATKSQKHVLSTAHTKNTCKHAFSGLQYTWAVQASPRRTKAAKGTPQDRQWEFKGIPKGAKAILKTSKGRPGAPQRTPGKSEVCPKDACRWPWTPKVARENVRKLEKARQNTK